MEVQVFPLVPKVVLPTPAPATTRSHVPTGYGVQEQCLPFTAATALGFLLGRRLPLGYVPLPMCRRMVTPFARPSIGQVLTVLLQMSVCSTSKITSIVASLGMPSRWSQWKLRMLTENDLLHQCSQGLVFSSARINRISSNFTCHMSGGRRQKWIFLFVPAINRSAQGLTGYLVWWRRTGMVTQ